MTDTAVALIFLSHPAKATFYYLWMIEMSLQYVYHQNTGISLRSIELELHLLQPLADR